MQKLRLAARFTRFAAPHVLALAQSAGAEQWRSMVLAAATAMQAMLPAKLGTLPQPVQDPEAWVTLCPAFPSQWKARLDCLQKSVLLDPVRALAVLQATPNLGFPVIDEVAEAEDQDKFLGGLCDRLFATRGARAVHRAKTHDVGTYAYLKQFVFDGTCPVCGTLFHT